MGALQVILDPAQLDALAERIAEHLHDRRAPRDEQQAGWLDSAQAAAYLGRSTTALHKLTAARSIPFSQDRPGAKCFFKRSDLDAWMHSR